MKRILCMAAVLTAGCLIGPAAAADVPAYVPAWAPAPVPVPVYDWNGFYGGAHLGGAWQQSSVWTTDPTGAGAAGSPSSFAGGGQLGVNFALWPRVMVGMEGDISGTFLHGNVSGANAIGTVLYDDKTEFYGTARGRAGYIWSNWLFYGTGGFAWSHEQVTRSQQAGVIGGAGPGTVEPVYTMPLGWVAGGGLEWAFAPKWTVRLEYLHLDLGPQPFLFTTSGVNRSVESTIDVFRVGLNYRFNLLSMGP
jgi:opacity protein-like surface antigen